MSNEGTETMENKQARKAHDVADSQVIYTSKGAFY